MSDPTYRAMAPDERARLEAELARAHANPVSVPQALAAAAGVLGAYLWKPLVALVLAAALAVTLLPGWLADLVARALGGAALVAAAGIALLVITANRSWMSFLTRLAQGVARDLADARVRVRTYRPVGAITLRLDAGPPVGWLLELEGSLVVFVPTALAAGADPFPAASIELAVAPESQVFVGARGAGPELPAPERSAPATALAPAMARPCVPVPGTLAALPAAPRAELP